MYAFHGYAIVSDDDRIADAQGRFPDSLKNEADWAYFQAGLDRAAVTLLGRRSHEASPNLRGRLRLVMSRSAPALERRPDGWWWNPAEVPLEQALAQVSPAGGEIAVPGGQEVFDFLGARRFYSFHLARAEGCRLPGGRGLFAACEKGQPAEAILAAGGLEARSRRWLDEGAGVSLTLWTKPG